MIFKAENIKELFQRWSALMQQQKDYLIDIDSVVGDADLGLTMSDGFLAAFNAIKDSDEKDIGKLVYFAGKAMASAVPSTMGTLISKGFMTAGKALRGCEELADKEIVVFFDEIYKGVQELGKAKPGEKTFLDGMTGSLQLLKEKTENGEQVKDFASQLASAAENDLARTRGMLAKHGRAAARGEASRPLLDPGAVVAKLMICEFADFAAE